MKITLFCSDPLHPVNAYLRSWIDKQQDTHDITLVTSKEELLGGDILFLVSCAEIISEVDRKNFLATYVLHASDLPRGRGWSPHIWEIINGANQITLSILEAENVVDSGKIVLKRKIPVPKHALWNEINHLLFSNEIELIEFVVKYFRKVTPFAQVNLNSVSYYPSRTPKDSEIDPSKSIVEQFDQIRVCDPNRYPAFFYYLGCRYTLKLEKINDK
jgi:methionyl-tRNA formyltransferase